MGKKKGRGKAAACDAVRSAVGGAVGEGTGRRGSSRSLENLGTRDIFRHVYAKALRQCLLADNRDIR